MLKTKKKYNFTEINTSEDGSRLVILGVLVFALILFVPYMKQIK